VANATQADRPNAGRHDAARQSHPGGLPPASPVRFSISLVSRKGAPYDMAKAKSAAKKPAKKAAAKKPAAKKAAKKK
jgi:hypothetical protein